MTRIRLFLALFLFCLLPGASPAAESLRVLVFSKTLMFRHASIPHGIKAVRQLGNDHGFQVDATEDSAVFTATNLSRYGVILFLSTSGDVLNDSQQEAFKDYLE